MKAILSAILAPSVPAGIAAPAAALDYNRKVTETSGLARRCKPQNLPSRMARERRSRAIAFS